MNFIITWVITYIVSLIMKIGNALKLYKDAADLGYKIINKNLNELDNKTSNLDIKDWLMFIPFINIIYNIYQAYIYSGNKDDLLFRLKVLGLLERMDIDEAEEYNNKPTAINAFLSVNKVKARKIQKEEMEEAIKDYEYTEKDRKYLLKYIKKQSGNNPEVLNYLKNDPRFSWIFEEKSSDLHEKLPDELEDINNEKDEKEFTKQKIKHYKKR